MSFLFRGRFSSRFVFLHRLTAAPRVYHDAAMNNRPTIEDLSLVVRALHQDVTRLDERLRRLEALVDAVRSGALSADELDLTAIENN